MKKDYTKVIHLITIMLITFALAGCQNAKNKNVVTDYTNGPGKVIYDFIVSKDGKSVADKVIITDAKNVTEDGGHQFNIYQYKEYTGQDEFIYFVLKQDDNGDWYIHKRVPDV
ncbi:hypothetical protein [Fredinandcohnia onubensis]|uniref:hypothetical protein n=1 Tax=Fredinandcohnia onubensis TaxID=1571209 RepID=UPI000C0BFB8F|nr:hypothetical protein [Fredinandcohnia onubensis]